MFLKNETGEPAEKNVRIAFSDRAVGPYGAASEPITGDYWAEGPSAIMIGETWYVYFDMYREHRYGAVRSEDFEDWEDVIEQLKMPKGAHHGTERGQLIGNRMSLYSDHPHAAGALIVRADEHRREKDDGGFGRDLPKMEAYDPEWWKMDMLPEPLRQDSGHGGSHNFLVHEFIDVLMHDRTPVIDVNEALAYTVPGIVADESALKGGEQLKIPQFVT